MKLPSIVTACVALVGLAALAVAHEGPPYPVVVDKKVGDYTLSVWADPDVGTGTFFVNFDPPAWKSDSDPRVWIEVWPTSGRLAPVRVEATHQPDESFVMRAQFDQQEMWQVHLHVEGSTGRGDTQFEVEATPPGYGRWDLLVYAGPFLIVGGFWILVVRRRRQMDREEAEDAAAPTTADAAQSPATRTTNQ